MAYVYDLSSTSAIPVVAIDNAEKDKDVTYVAAFVAVGLFFSVLSYALAPPEWLPEGTVAPAPEMSSAGLIISEMKVPAGLDVAEYPAH